MTLLTPPNLVTLLRLGLAGPAAVAILWGADAAASAIILLAILTDVADGALARRLGRTTSFGRLLDHGSDAAFVTLALAALAGRGEVPALLPALVALAFLQYALDSRAHRGGTLRASALGRWNGIAYYVLAAVPVGREALGLAVPGAPLVMIAGYALILSTVLSMADRLAAQLGRRG